VSLNLNLILILILSLSLACCHFSLFAGDFLLLYLLSCQTQFTFIECKYLLNICNLIYSHSVRQSVNWSVRLVSVQLDDGVGFGFVLGLVAGTFQLAKYIFYEMKLSGLILLFV